LSTYVRTSAGDYASAITRYPRMASLCVYVVGIN
jgi:hypothetical protein